MTTTEHSPRLTAHSLSAHVRRRVSDIAHFTTSPDAHERLAEGSIHPVRALVLRAVLATPGLPQFIHDQVNVKGYRQAGFNVLGVGYTAVAVQDGPRNVRKFYRHTAGESEESQLASIDTWQNKQALVLQHLGRYAIPQSFSIVENPLNPTETIVTATQERIDVDGAISIWQPNEIPTAAHPFLADSLKMHEQSDPEAVPDLLGNNNALIERHTGAIKLIDPIPFVRTDPGDTKSYERTAQFLRAFHARTHRS